MNSYFEQNNNYLEYKNTYVNLPSIDPYIVSQDMNIIPKESFFVFSEKDDVNKENNFTEKITQANSKDNDSFYLEKLIKEKKLLYFEKNKNSDNNPTFQLEPPKYSKIEKENENEEKNKKKLCGQKRVRNEESSEKHDKYADDIIRRKCKHLLFKNLFDFLNNRIKFVYKGKLGNSIFKKQLKIINQYQIANPNIEFNQNLLTKKIGDIFSEDISGKYTNLPLNHNKNLIYKLMNEKDENKKIYFQKLFNLTFIQCLKHFRGEETIELLDGLTLFKDLKNKIVNQYKEDGVEYYEVLEYYINNFEEIINNKRPRKLRNKKK